MRKYLLIKIEMDRQFSFPVHIVIKASKQEFNWHFMEMYSGKCFKIYAVISTQKTISCFVVSIKLFISSMDDIVFRFFFYLELSRSAWP